MCFPNGLRNITLAYNVLREWLDPGEWTLCIWTKVDLVLVVLKLSIQWRFVSEGGTDMQSTVVATQRKKLFH